MKITIYTVPECPFSKQEKDYLTSLKMAFEEKDVEKDRTALSEMLEVSDKFAGVPFTRIVKDDGTEIKLKGFTREEFAKALAIDPAVEGIGPKVDEPAQAGPQNVVKPIDSTTDDTIKPETPPHTDELKGVMDNLGKFSEAGTNEAANPPAGGPASSPIQSDPTTIPPAVNPLATPTPDLPPLNSAPSNPMSSTPPPIQNTPQTDTTNTTV